MPRKLDGVIRVDHANSTVQSSGLYKIAVVVSQAVWYPWRVRRSWALTDPSPTLARSDDEARPVFEVDPTENVVGVGIPFVFVVSDLFSYHSFVVVCVASV